MKLKLGLEDVLPKGHRKGEQIEDVIEDDPELIAYWYENDIATFDHEVIKLLEAKKII